MADLLHRLGDIPPERIRLHPPPGTATEKDVIRGLEAPRKRLCELIEGVLVEKPMGVTEAILAGIIVHMMWDFLEEHPLGIPIGPDGPFRCAVGLVRIPDVSFVSWERIPGEAFPADAISKLIPELTIEVLSKRNTPKEMKRKLREYFKAGVRIAWLIYPKTQTAEIYSSPTRKRRVRKDGILRCEDILPGFGLSLKRLFAMANQRRPQ
jgi:Uma2 family endonuclease